MVFLQYKAELEHPFLKAAYKQCYFYSADKGLKQQEVLLCYG